MTGGQALDFEQGGADELWPPAVLNLQPVWSGGRHHVTFVCTVLPIFGAGKTKQTVNKQKL